ncbi:MAG: alpha/beta fold hydrolase [Nitrospinae bacterium]|nr:alpha/beta fold hydrolase [Nitrospinota bacterium]
MPAPLVFVHGWSVNAGVWEAQTEHFEDKFQVHTFTFPGHGDEPPVEGTLTIQRLGNLLARMLDAKDLRGAHLVGWSMGAQVAIHAADMAKERVRSLTIVGGTPCFTAPAPDAKWATPLTKSKWFYRSMKSDYQNSLRDFIMRFFEAEKELGSDGAERIKHLFFDRHFPPDERSALELLDDLMVSDIRALAATITLPSLIVHGAHDRIVPVEVTGLWGELLRPSGTEVIAGCGHAPFISFPELFNRRLETFLEGLR